MSFLAGAAAAPAADAADAGVCAFAGFKAPAAAPATTAPLARNFRRLGFFRFIAEPPWLGTFIHRDQFAQRGISEERQVHFTCRSTSESHPNADSPGTR